MFILIFDFLFSDVYFVPDLMKIWMLQMTQNYACHTIMRILWNWIRKAKPNFYYANRQNRSVNFIINIMILDTRQAVHVRYPARFFSTQWTKNRKMVQKHKFLFTCNVGSIKDNCQTLISRIFSEMSEIHSKKLL